MIFFLYVFGTLYVATLAVMLACVSFALLVDAIWTVSWRLSFLTRKALGLCRNKFRGQ